MVIFRMCRIWVSRRPRRDCGVIWHGLDQIEIQCERSGFLTVYYLNVNDTYRPVPSRTSPSHDVRVVYTSDSHALTFSVSGEIVRHVV